jgi:quercetin dioxygenase-like cupin family protein
MQIPFFSFQAIDWNHIPRENHPGETSFATWQVLYAGNIRVRRMVYEPGYRADHWCHKGHILHCTEGELTTELQDGRIFILKPGMTYLVGDDSDSHRSRTETGCTLFVVD